MFTLSFCYFLTETFNSLQFFTLPWFSYPACILMQIYFSVLQFRSLHLFAPLSFWIIFFLVALIVLHFIPWPQLLKKMSRIAPLGIRILSSLLADVFGTDELSSLWWLMLDENPKETHVAIEGQQPIEEPSNQQKEMHQISTQKIRTNKQERKQTQYLTRLDNLPTTILGQGREIIFI